MELNTKSDGIALTPDTKTLIYCVLSSTELYKMPTSVIGF